MTVTDTATLAEDLAAVRRRTLDLVAHLGRADLERQIAPIMSPLVTPSLKNGPMVFACRRVTW